MVLIFFYCWCFIWKKKSFLHIFSFLVHERLVERSCIFTKQHQPPALPSSNTLVLLKLIKPGRVSAINRQQLGGVLLLSFLSFASGLAFWQQASLPQYSNWSSAENKPTSSQMQGLLGLISDGSAALLHTGSQLLEVSCRRYQIASPPCALLPFGALPSVTHQTSWWWPIGHQQFRILLVDCRFLPVLRFLMLQPGYLKLLFR